MISPLSSFLPALADYAGRTGPGSRSVKGGTAPALGSAPAPKGWAADKAMPDWGGGYGQSLGRSSLGGARGTGSAALSPEIQRQLDKLKQTDRQVRAHEQAHMAAGGALVRGAATYSYQKGPDGQLYAVGGEVSIDISPGRTPEETISKAAQIRAAALAPANPSGQDRSVAASAARMEAAARAELASRAPQGNGDTSRGEAGALGAAGSAEERSGATAVDVVAVSRRLQSAYGAAGAGQGPGAINFYA